MVREKPIQPKEQQGAKKKKNRLQINITLDKVTYERLKDACTLQEHTESQLGRILLEWALPFYERSRSVELLKHLAVKYFTSLPDAPLEQRKNDTSMALAAGGR